jgi:hypothetical protein
MRTHAERARTGIPLTADVVTALQAEAAQAGVPFPEAPGEMRNGATRSPSTAAREAAT